MDYEGTWTGQGYVYEFVLHIEDLGTNVVGYFTWTLVSTPWISHLISKIGASGKEFVKGTFDSINSILIVRGYKLDADAVGLVALDEYELNLVDGEVYGVSKGFYGRIFAKKVTPNINKNIDCCMHGTYGTHNTENTGVCEWCRIKSHAGHSLSEQKYSNEFLSLFLGGSCTCCCFM